MPARFRVRIAKASERDIEDIWNLIARDSIRAATDLVAHLENQIATLERFPERCSLIPENELLGTRYRHLLFGKYRTILRVSGKTVYILRVVDGARLLDVSHLESR